MDSSWDQTGNLFSSGDTTVYELQHRSINRQVANRVVKHREIWSSCAAEQFHSDASLEVGNRRALNNSKNWQWMTEGDVSGRRSPPVPHAAEGPFSFLQAVGSTLVYCYRCTNVGLVNLWTSAAPWIACKNVFIYTRTP
ncbi:uncharacterized protein TNCV_3810661 [Trichonephila clavipes]|nr:uncharacterized protein TNCV_3810661 [Trichonephila clavipes]